MPLSRKCLSGLIYIVIISLVFGHRGWRRPMNTYDRRSSATSYFSVKTQDSSNTCAPLVCFLIFFKPWGIHLGPQLQKSGPSTKWRIHSRVTCQADLVVAKTFWSASASVVVHIQSS